MHCDICDAIYELEKSFTHNSLAIANNALGYAISKNYKIALDLNEKISDEKLKKTHAVSKKFNSRIKARKKLQETPATTIEEPSAQQAAKSPNVIRETIV